MEKINHRNNERDLIDRLLKLLEARYDSSMRAKRLGKIVEPATYKQLNLLAELGIRPKWQATREEADELICHYNLILETASRRGRIP